MTLVLKTPFGLSKIWSHIRGAQGTENEGQINSDMAKTDFEKEFDLGSLNSRI